VARFDPKSFSRNEWGILGGVLVAFIGLFFNAFHARATFLGRSVGGSLLGWHFAGLWVPVLFLAIPAAALVVVRALRSDLIPTLPVGTRLIVGAALIGATLITMIRGLTYPGDSFNGTGVDIGASIGTYLVCIAVAVATAFAILDFIQSGEKLPALPAKPAGATPASPPETPSAPDA